MSSDRVMTLGEANRQFLGTLASEETKTAEPEINRFIRWFGTDYPIAALSAPEVEAYAERLSSSDSDYANKIEQVKVFLAYAKKEGLINTNLATHMKPRRGKTRAGAANKPMTVTSLTRGKLDELRAELEGLKDKRDSVIGDIRRAAADKDFRENAPLEAAREEHGRIMGRMREIEETVKCAVVIGEKPDAEHLKVNIGDTVVLEDTVTGEEMCYMIVSTREVNPSQGKISNASPVGKAVLGKEQGRKVEVTTPAGKISLRIKAVQRG